MCWNYALCGVLIVSLSIVDSCLCLSGDRRSLQTGYSRQREMSVRDRHKSPNGGDMFAVDAEDQGCPKSQTGKVWPLRR